MGFANDVIPGLLNLGHALTAPTLTGLGERRHNGIDDTDLSTRIDDVIAHIEMVGAIILNYIDEVIGLVQAAAKAAAVPISISFTVETDGRLPSGETLQEAVERSNVDTDSHAAFFM
jgi:hypothetical protein